MVISKSLPVIMAAFILVPSCARLELKREMKRFRASEIVLPAEMEKSQGGAIVPVHREELSGPKMVVFIDSTECTSCRLSKLMVYDSVERLWSVPALEQCHLALAFLCLRLFVGNACRRRWRH